MAAGVPAADRARARRRWTSGCEAERLDGRAKRMHRRKIDGLPDGAFISLDGEPFAVRGDSLLHWTPAGYDARKRRPHGVTVDVLTPPADARACSKPATSRTGIRARLRIPWRRLRSARNVAPTKPTSLMPR